MALLISCETAGTTLPERWFDSKAAARWREQQNVDLLGGELAERLASDLDAPCLKFEYPPDLVDVTHSENHRRLFGKLTKNWPRARKQELLDQVYHPYREAVEGEVTTILQHYQTAIHLDVRTFDLRQGDKIRRADVGLLYDPARVDEFDLCVEWIDELYYEFPNLRVRRNYPRRGTADSLTKAMRGRFDAEQYIGIEVWMNRAWVRRKVRLREEALSHFVRALKEILGLPMTEAA